MSSLVSRPPAANSQVALTHFETLLQYETDCWDVHHAMNNNRQDFVLVDVRSEWAYQKEHIQGAINIPYPKMTAENLMPYTKNILFVVYCAGSHCNATEKAAIKLAKLNCPVKKMIGGITGWIDEGFDLNKAPQSKK